MGFRRYVAASAREAMDRIRKELGPDAIILSNRRSNTTGRVEIIAAAPAQMDALVDEVAAPVTRGAERRPAPTLAPAEARAALRARAEAPARVTPQSFQEFIRQHGPQSPQTGAGSRRADAVAMYNAVSLESEAPAEEAMRAGAWQDAPRAEAAPAVFRRRPSRLGEAAPQALAPVAPAAPAAVAPVVPAALAVAAPVLAPVAEVPAMPAPMVQVQLAPAQLAAALAAAPAAAVAAAPAPATILASADTALMAELQSLRLSLSDRLTNLEAQLAPKPEPARAAPEPVAAAAAASVPAAVPAPTPVPAPAVLAPALALKRRAMTRLIMSGFSPELARRIGEAVPADLDPKDADNWLQDLLARQLRCPAEADNPLFAQGAVALVGPTGVGKTTTAAKLAARFVVRHGAASLGLITLDSYRMGAHEQLRSYGRILGVPVQIAHDAATLRDQLAALHGKRKVIIDTCGMSQRDQRLAEMLGMLAETRFAGQEIQRVLLVNAASHAETLDEVARAWRVASAHGAVLTKIDEAARIGGGLDALIRYQQPLLGLTNGQRVPEDWHPANPNLLAHIALKPFGAAFTLDSKELDALAGTGAALV